jgi:hypothetical protein
VIISRAVLLRMRNISDKICSENQSKYFMSKELFFLKSYMLWANMKKYYTAEHATDNNIKRGMLHISYDSNMFILIQCVLL